MKVEILKDHPSGLKKGQTKTVEPHIGKLLVAEGIAKEVKKKKEDKK